MKYTAPQVFSCMLLCLSAQTTILSVHSFDQVEERIFSEQRDSATPGTILFLVDIDGVLLQTKQYIDFSSLSESAQGQSLLEESGNSRKMIRIIRRLDQQQHVLGFSARSSAQLPGCTFTGFELLQRTLGRFAAEFRGERFNLYQTLRMPLAAFPSKPRMFKIETKQGCRAKPDHSEAMFDEDFRPYSVSRGRTPKAPVIYENIVYTNYVKKGYALFLLLQQHFFDDERLRYIVAIDDQLSNLEHMEKYMIHFNRVTGANLRFLGFHYGPYSVAT